MAFIKLCVLVFVFIGFILSQFTVALGFYDLALVGSFSVNVIFVGFVSYIYLLSRVGVISFPVRVLPVLFMYLLFLFVFLYHFIYAYVLSLAAHTRNSHVVFLVFYVVMPLFGYVLFYRDDDYGKRWVLFFLVLLFLVSLWFSTVYGDIRSYYVAYGGQGFQFNYQAIGAIVFVLFVYVQNQKSLFLSYLAWFSALGCCYVVGARSELISLILVFFLNFLLIGKNVFSLFYVRFFVVGIYILGLILFVLFVLVASYQSEIAALDLSLSERLSILSSNLEYIFQSPFWGAYSAYESGRYAHNLLSVWVDFGFPSFLLLCCIFSFVLFRYLSILPIMRSCTTFKCGLILHLSVVFLMFTFKDYGYFIFPLSLGVYILVERRYIAFRRNSKMGLKYAF